MLRNFTALAAVLMLAAPQVQAQTAPADSTQVVVKAPTRPKLAEEAAPPPLDVYTQSPRIEQITLSPDGSRFAFVTRKAGSRLLTVYNVKDSTNQVIRLSEDPLSALTFLDNDHIILSEARTGLRGTCPAGDAQSLKAAQVISDYLEAATGGAGSALASLLTPPPCAVYGVRSQDAATVVDLRSKTGITVGDRMSDFKNLALGLPKPVMVDGKLMLVGPFLELRDKSIGGQVAQRVYLWQVDAATGYGRIVDDKGGDLDRIGSYVDDWLTDEAGRPTVRAQYTYGSEAFTIEARKDGKWVTILKRKIDAKAHTFAPFIVGRGRDGQSLLILDATVDASGPRRFRYYELSLDGKLSEPLDEDATRDRPVFHPQTGALAGFAHDGEVTTYTFFDPDLAEYYSHAVDTGPGQAVRVVAMAKDPGQMILFAQGGDDPGSWHYYDFVEGKRVDIGSQYPAVPPEWVASQRTVHYTAADGLDITAQVTLPPKGEAKNRAAVVLPHDGPLSHDGRGFDWLAQALASRGYVVLQPNYRGSDGYGAALTEAGNGQWSGKALSDLADGVKYLTSQGMVDPKRVCIAGEGYGGYAALASASQYRCAIAINGIADPSDYLGTAKGNAVADEIAALKADPLQPRAFLADAASPALAQRYFGSQTPAAITASSIKAPVLLVTSQYDKAVSPGQSRTLRDGLQRAGKHATYVELPDCGHDLATEACRLATAQATVDFLAANNPAK